MLSAFIHSIRCYPAVPLARQQDHKRYLHSGPLVLGADLLNLPTGMTDRDQPVSRRFEPNSRISLIGEQPNTVPSIWTLGHYQPVIPRVAFIRWAMAIPFWTTGSLWPSFLPARLVSLAVKHPYTITLLTRFPTVLRVPLRASVTFWEATAPVKLPT